MKKKKLSSCLDSLTAMSYLYMLVAIILAVVIPCSAVHCDSPVHHDTTVAHLDGAHHQGPAPPTPGGNPPHGYIRLPPPPIAPCRKMGHRC
ncbi:hypothetical protein BS78_K088400 [Paspalum vaginatum]|uniref:Uncharacterized protein n=1 Tax=Paspalum vaginatum TaxID=158149 RepID=A0A9W7X9W9_9POAL|nr:hypothetical protein BS78_K088400 [Paspalum vaginatum]